jgi:AFG3 family protein
MQVKAAGVAANKAPGSKNTRFKLQENIKTKLADVAGLTEVKHEVTEIVHMLKKPEHYTRLGARVPRGVLIDGPPGVGKTLLAKAVAGEAGLPFMSCSGSEFDEVYVGVGAKRVRELFATAKKHKPCIIFIDEIDTFGRKRRNDRNGSSRATINALLNELDGFTESSEVMVLAATNRADTLDEALTRSGRFDRKISVDMPPHPDRVAIAKVHLAPINLHPSLSIASVAETVATMTPGCSGADIYNICNEAAITASRLQKEAVDLDCFTIAMDRIMIGMEKKAKSLSNSERERIAFHEAGKVVLTWFLETTDPVLKSTIAPRGGRRSGVTKKLPKDRFINTQTMLRERMIHQLGGYVAEEHFFEDVSSNAAEDLRQVTNMAHHEIATYGMDPANVGHFGWQENDQAIQKPYGAHKADQIDHAVQTITEEVMRRARDLRQTHLEQIRIVAGLLLKNETVTARELWTVLGERPHMTDEFRKYLETAAA